MIFLSLMFLWEVIFVILGLIEKTKKPESMRKIYNITFIHHFLVVA